MLSKAKIKYIKSLQVKKYRLQEQCFTVEGEKSVLEILAADYHVTSLVVTQDFYSRHQVLCEHFPNELIIAGADDLASAGEFKTNSSALAIARMKEQTPIHPDGQEFALVLDDVRDPGNLGAIIRVADWYGFTKIVASPETADVYNPKVLHASMGSFTRVQLFYTELVPFLSVYPHPIYGTFLTGDNVHEMKWTKGGVIVIGNEAHGISAPVEALVTTRITIPRFGGADSLNAAIATAVILDGIRRG
jgi:RNA methyltransferase, TrmH family